MPDTAKRKIIVRGLKRSAKSAPVANPRFAEIVDAKPHAPAKRPTIHSSARMKTSSSCTSRGGYAYTPPSTD